MKTVIVVISLYVLLVVSAVIWARKIDHDRSVKVDEFVNHSEIK